MYTRALLGVVLIGHAIAEPPTTPSPGLDYNGLQQGHPWAEAIKIHRDLKLKARYGPALDACYGKKSICAEWGDLDDECPIPPSADDYPPWYECLCGTGWLSTFQACNWCMESFGDEPIGDTSYWADICKENDLSIAPIPSSILSIESAFNATNTLINTNLASSGGSNSATKTTPRSGHTSSTTSRRSITKHTTTSTLWGGNGGGPITDPPTVQSASSLSGPATVTITAKGGASVVAPDLQTGAIFSGLVVLLTMIGTAVFHV